MKNLKNMRRKTEQEIKELKDNINILNKGLDDMDTVIDRQEQHSCQIYFLI